MSTFLNVYVSVAYNTVLQVRVFTRDRKHIDKKLSCRRETVRRFVSLILLSHSSSLKVIRNNTVSFTYLVILVKSSAALVVMRCLCVCVSVTFVHYVKTNKHIFNFFQHRVATPFKFSHIKRHSNIPTATP